MSIKLDKWQEDVLASKGDILLCTGRRVGKTYILSRKAIDKMMTDKVNVIVVSLTEDQAMLIIQMALAYARERYPKFIGRGKDKPTLKTLTINGCKLISRPVGNTGDAIRGFEGGVLIVDEASRMPSLFWIASKPVLLTKAGEIWMSSTPHGKQGYFWDRFNEAHNLKMEDARFQVFYVTTDQVMKERPISDVWTEEQKEGAIRILEQEKREMSATEYGQEYLGLFLDELRQYFSDELLDKVMTEIRQEKPIRESNFMGVDIARFGGDKIAYQVLHRKNEKNIVQVESIIKDGQSTDKTEAEITQLTKIWGCLKVGIDAGAGALGVGIYDRLMTDPEMKRIVIPMNNREIILDREGKKKQRIFKEDMYENLHAMMEKGEIKLLNDMSLRLSLKSVQIEYEEGGKTRIFGNDTHGCEGLVRASWLAKKEKINKLWIGYI